MCFYVYKSDANPLTFLLLLARSSLCVKSQRFHPLQVITTPYSIVIPTTCKFEPR
jgi:hypothetical protein